MDEIRNKVAVVGVGYSPFTRQSGRTVLDQAVEAITNALTDAGLTPRDVDGIAEFHMWQDSPFAIDVSRALGVPGLRWYSDEDAGGHYAVNIVSDAAMAIFAGSASVVVVYRALNGRSGFRYGSGRKGRPLSGDLQFTMPYGLSFPAQMLALGCKRHMHEYGTTEEQLGHMCITFRNHAMLNERAVMKKPLTVDEYLATRYVTEPLRVHDCAIEVDGACALVLTSADRAKGLKQPPAYIVGFESVLGSPALWFHWREFTRMYASYFADRLWEKTGLRPPDMDFAEVYDCFTYNPLCTLEDLGFCKKGEGGPFATSGAIDLGGSIPVNTHGGLMSEGYLQGLNHSCEAVLQLRGQCGAHQVAGAKVGLVTGGVGPFGGAIIYASEPI